MVLSALAISDQVDQQIRKTPAVGGRALRTVGPANDFRIAMRAAHEKETCG